MSTGAYIAVEFRHNDEPLGRVYDSGAVEMIEDVPHGEVRFWVGRRAWRNRLRDEFVFRHSASSAGASTPTG